MVRFELNDDLKNIILKSSIEDYAKEKLLAETTISSQNLMSFYKLCRPTDSLLGLIRKTKMLIKIKEEQKPKPKTTEYVQLMETLRKKEKELEYKKLLSSKDDFNLGLNNDEDLEGLSPNQVTKELKNQLTTILNIFISVASVVYAIWYWTETSMNISAAYRVLLCFFFAILILVAEVVVYMGYLSRIEEAKVKEKKKMEVKKIVKTIDLKH